MKPSWIACWVTEKAPGDHRLAGDDRGRGGEEDQRQAQHVGREIEERILDLGERRRGVGGQDHRALAHDS